MPRTEARIQLVGADGNAFSILGRARRAMRRAKVSPEVIEEYTRRATSGDYDNLVAVTLEYLICDEDEDE